MAIIAKFPIEVKQTYGIVFIPSLMKLQEHWSRTSDDNKQPIRDHFAAQGIDADKLISEPGAYQTEGEIPYRPLPIMQPKRETPVHSWYHEQAYANHIIQRDIK